MKNKLNIGVIGLGVGARHARTLHLNKKVNLISLCDFDNKKINLYKKIFKNCNFTNNSDDVFKNPNIDIVIIASYDNFHAKHILQAIKYNKDFFVEKPFCLNINELNNINLNLKKNKKIRFSSNLILRNNPAFLDLKKKIKRKIIGDVYYCEGDYNYGRINKILNGWRGQIPFYSVVLGGAIHLIDLIIWLSNKKVRSVIADGNNISTKNTKFKNYDLVSALLKFEDGMIGKVTSNFASVTSHHHILNVYGTKSTFFYNNGVIKSYKSRDKSYVRKINNIFSYKWKSEILNSFIDSVYYQKDLKIVHENEIINLMSVCLAIEKSLKTKKWENVKYINFKNTYNLKK
jgi:predicted dehydrogenase